MSSIFDGVKFQPNPKNCDQFAPNLFKKLECRNCYESYLLHLGTISEKDLKIILELEKKKLALFFPLVSSVFCIFYARFECNFSVRKFQLKLFHQNHKLNSKNKKS